MATAQELPGAASHRLDIVRDCADLAGTFPKNVSIKFVLWEHGTIEDLEDGSYYDRLIPHLADANIVAKEETFSDSVTKVDSVERHAIFNKYLRGEFAKTPESMEVPVAPWHISLKLALLNGREALPEFVPLDAHSAALYATLPENADARGNTMLEVAAADAAWMRKREAITVRQLHEHAMRLAKDGKEHQIAVIYGMGHSFLPIATRALGAPTSRVFVDDVDHYMRPGMALERSLRFKTDSQAIESFAQQVVKATTVGYSISTWAKRADFKAHLTTKKPDELKPVDLDRKLAMLVLREVMGNLTAKQQADYNKLVGKIAPYVMKDKKPSFIKRQAIQETVDSLVSLAIDARSQ